MQRISFRRAIQHGMQQKSIAIELPRKNAEELALRHGALPFDNTASPSLKRRLAKSLKGLVRFIARPVVARLMGPLRRLLVEHIEARIGNVQSVQYATSVKLDQTLAMLQKTQQTLAGLDKFAASGHSLEGMAQQLAELEARMGALRARVDDVSIKVRGPLELDDGSRAVRTADGYAVVPKQDVTLTLMLIDADVGGLEPGTRSVLRKVLKPGATFVDIGAHIGLLTLTAARVVGPLGRVYAFEASPTTFALLERTVALNHCAPPVQARSVAVGRASEQRIFHVRDVMGHSSLYDFSTEDEGGTVAEIMVDVRTLDELIPVGEPVDVIKIDVEGAELDVLAGMPRILTSNPEIVVIAEFGPSHLVRTGVTPDDWFAAFAAHGFIAFAIDEETGRCRRVTPADVADVDSINIVFVAPFSAAATLLEHAPQ